MTSIYNFSGFELAPEQKKQTVGGSERPWVLRHLSAHPTQEEIDKLLGIKEPQTPTLSRESVSEESDEYIFDLEEEMDADLF